MYFCLSTSQIQAQIGSYVLLGLQITDHSNEIRTGFAILPWSEKISPLTPGEIIDDIYMTATGSVSTDILTFYATYNYINYPDCGEDQPTIISLQSPRIYPSINDIKRIRFISKKKLSDCILTCKLNIKQISKLNTSPSIINVATIALPYNDVLYGLSYAEDHNESYTLNRTETMAQDLASAGVNCNIADYQMIKSVILSSSDLSLIFLTIRQKMN